MDLLEIILRIFFTIVMVGFVIITVFAIQINNNTNRYIATVKDMLNEANHPIMSIDQIVSLQRKGATPRQAADFIINEITLRD